MGDVESVCILFQYLIFFFITFLSNALIRLIYVVSDKDFDLGTLERK